jgi:hypothetical protein
VAPIAVIPAGVFPAVWSTGLLGQHRTVSVAYSAFLALWFVATIAVAGRRLEPVAPTTVASWQTAIAAALVLAVAFTGNGYAVTTDLITGRARRFAAAMEARSAALAACRDAHTRPCIIEQLSESLHGVAVSSGSVDAGWAVQSHARYFGVSAFELRPVPSDVRH